MALITDPDDLTPTEVTITTSTRKVLLNEAGNLSSDGVTLQALYSYLKDVWVSDATLQPYPFPIISISPEKMDWLFNWEFSNDASRKLIRNGGWREYNSSSVLKEEWVGCISLDIGALTVDVSDTAYYHFSSLTAKADFTYPGKVNESIQTYGDSAHGDFNYRADVLSLYVREQGKLYASSNSTSIGYSINDYSVGRYPLGEGTDLNIIASDNTIETTTPYTNMSITFLDSAASQDIPSSGDPHNFGITVAGATGTVTEIYEFLQHALRQNTDIDAGTSGQIGLLTDSIAIFIGTRLDSLAVTNDQTGGTGTFLANVATNDTNNMRMIDNLGTYYEYPFVSTGRISFNANISGDTSAIYRMYFKYTEGTSLSDCAITSTAGNDSIFTSSGNLPVLVATDYFIVEGAANANNNEFGSLRELRVHHLYQLLSTMA